MVVISPDGGHSSSANGGGGAGHMAQGPAAVASGIERHRALHAAESGRSLPMTADGHRHQAAGRLTLIRDAKPICRVLDIYQLMPAPYMMSSLSKRYTCTYVIALMETFLWSLGKLLRMTSLSI